MSDMGDLTNFLKDGGLANLDWLDVDEQQYRELETLPKQNLDVKPELMALWRTDDPSGAAFVPNQARLPRTMGDMSQYHGPIRQTPPEVISRTARLAMMQSDDANYLQDQILRRFDQNSLSNARTALASALAERGLLGRFYIDASDFPGCASDPKASQFVQRFAAKAPFVKAKTECGGCVHAQSGRCSIFHKMIVPEVPYSEAMAEAVEKEQVALGKKLAGTGEPRERIKTAFLAPVAAQQATQAYSGQPNVASRMVPVSALTSKKVRVAADKEAELKEAKARPVVALLRREMLKGRSAKEIVAALKLAFDVRDLQATQAQWSPLLQEVGLYGRVYTTQDSFDNCREGADFLARHGSKTKAVVAGEKCSSCVYAAAGFCQLYGRPLIATPEAVYTPEVVKQAIWEEKLSGNLPGGTSETAVMKWGSTPREILAAIYRVGGAGPSPIPSTSRSVIERAHVMAPMKAYNTTELTKRTIVKTARRYLNEGLYGHDLGQALRSQFDPRDIKAAFQDLKAFLTEQGLQGIKYIDPSVYDDYGKGCREAQALHRSRQIPFVKAASACGSCVHQTYPGYCSVMNKALVAEVPYVDKNAEQQAILASGPATEIDYTSLVNNGLTAMQEYQLQRQESVIEISEPITAGELEIELTSDTSIVL